MKIILDTNILVHAYNAGSPSHAKAAGILRDSLEGNLEAAITSQIIFEFYAVITDPRRISHPLSPAKAAEICAAIWNAYEIEKISQSTLTPNVVLQLASELELAGADLFDCVLAVTAKENNINTIYTQNTEDFKRFGFLTVLNPLENHVAA